MFWDNAVTIKKHGKHNNNKNPMEISNNLSI